MEVFVVTFADDSEPRLDAVEDILSSVQGVMGDLEGAKKLAEYCIFNTARICNSPADEPAWEDRPEESEWEAHTRLENGMQVWVRVTRTKVDQPD